MKINLGKYFDLGNLLSEKYNFHFTILLRGGGGHEHPKAINDFKSLLHF